jgi:hypothetical protein
MASLGRLAQARVQVNPKLRRLAFQPVGTLHAQATFDPTGFTCYENHPVKSLSGHIEPTSPVILSLSKYFPTFSLLFQKLIVLLLSEIFGRK